MTTEPTEIFNETRLMEDAMGNTIHRTFGNLRDIPGKPLNQILENFRKNPGIGICGFLKFREFLGNSHNESDFRKTGSLNGSGDSPTNFRLRNSYYGKKKRKGAEFSCFFPYTEKFPYTGLIGKTETGLTTMAIRESTQIALKAMTPEALYKARLLRWFPLSLMDHRQGESVRSFFPSIRPLRRDPFVTIRVCDIWVTFHLKLGRVRNVTNTP